ncbi:isoprenoid biosynthesis glyoxalase ElbB [Ancylomarina sp. 16SWW S1-10-2]|uniref:isoprenoid biosynthesis glyoxalase ElbB n=1 Tax=Ancylomarina sp. 16SWW S1-10-2 TaxID=2499681 RepID=UPI0012AE1412|nr:isoprenoid biosynthesis glyoxalase ElbB [Ancylomarina sp. 16SWW S1-10-2]MRT91755.1 isoprenoid biosynthesis protein ElbB [Ancylomarina sp. 16SWW S1-10-2]
MKKMKKIAVLLSGCGVYDGSEVHEATLSLYAISKNGGVYQIFAPNIDQHHVVNHLTGEEMDETRNVLVESARIARGDIKDLAEFNANDFDAILLPGGFGVAKNLCSLAFDGADCKVNSDVERVIKEMHAASKPIAALCIAPALIAKVITGSEVTIGSDKGTEETIEAMGSHHKQAGHGEVVIDVKNKIVTTPCYMLDATIAQIGEGAENVVKTLMEM